MPGPDLEFRHGAIELLILKTLSWGAAHGYTVAGWIQTITNDALRLEEGSLYPALHRLENKGWIEGSWGISENKRRAKFYSLTARGKRELHAETESWMRFADAVGKVLRTARQPT